MKILSCILTLYPAPKMIHNSSPYDLCAIFPMSRHHAEVLNEVHMSNGVI